MCVCVKFQLSSWSRAASENYSGSGGVGWVQSGYIAISVQLQLQLPAGTEPGKIPPPIRIVYFLLFSPEPLSFSAQTISGLCFRWSCNLFCSSSCWPSPMKGDTRANNTNIRSTIFLYLSMHNCSQDFFLCQKGIKFYNSSF